MTSETSPAPTTPPTSSGDTTASRCAYYRRCGLPARIEKGTNQIRMRATRDQTAVMMPADLARTVRTLLDKEGPGCGPVVSVLRSNCWVFLVTGPVPTVTPLRHRIQILDNNAVIGLPSPQDEDDQRRAWIAGPHLTLPPMSMVLDLVRRHPNPAGSR